MPIGNKADQGFLGSLFYIDSESRGSTQLFIPVGLWSPFLYKEKTQGDKRMLLTVKAKTSVKDLVIDYIQITTETGQSIALNWEQSHVTRTDTGFATPMAQAICTSHLEAAPEATTFLAT